MLFRSDFEARASEFLSLLAIWNRKINLVSRRLTLDDLARQLVSALAPLAVFDRGAARFLDIGSGGGFPGVVLALARPAWSGVLVEATRKKCLFLREAVEVLALKGVEVVNARYEECELETGTFDLVTARAVRLDRGLAERMRVHLAPDGTVIVFAPQDEPGRQELAGDFGEAGLASGPFREIAWAGAALLQGRHPA